MRASKPILAVLIASLSAACEDDKDTQSRDNAVATDGGLQDGASPALPSRDASLDARTSDLDSTVPDGSASPMLDGGADPALIARGKYLTTHVFPCGGCHTPRIKGVPDLTQLFGGVECYSDSVPGDAGVGCLNSANLTNDDTGLKQLTDQQVKDAFLKGLQPDGTALFPRMPYAVLGNMSAGDADAIVAYLRSLPPVTRHLAPNQPPFDVRPAAPEERWPESAIPQPRPDYQDRAAALRGRYLAGDIGHCLDCHTPRDASGASIYTKAFQGGRKFGTDPVSGPIYSANLTPDATGLLGWTVDDIVRVIKQGVDKDGFMLCPPMPVGPNGAYGGITDEDARDLANYLLSLPPAVNVLPRQCQATPVTDAGTGLDAGTDASVR
ncbi:MAG: putative diheme cytochrome c-553 [Myxococcaceae bacterium]|nr:putative diheme cytochrome c-553 [Myxococcaceae bacterium]